MERLLTIWLLNPYHTGSHRAWAEGYASHSRHRVHPLSMTGNFWKWRMHGGALELAEQTSALLAAGERPDLLLATSMVNLPAFFALARRELASVPTMLFMHKNQLTYPPPPGAKRDLTYGMIQHLSMLATDRVCFNSAYHWRAGSMSCRGCSSTSRITPTWKRWRRHRRSRACCRWGVIWRGWMGTRVDKETRKQGEMRR